MILTGRHSYICLVAVRPNRGVGGQFLRRISSTLPPLILPIYIVLKTLAAGLPFLCTLIGHQKWQIFTDQAFLRINMKKKHHLNQ